MQIIMTQITEHQEEIARLLDLQMERTNQFERDKEELNRQLVRATLYFITCINMFFSTVCTCNPKETTNDLTHEEMTANIKLTRYIIAC